MAKIDTIDMSKILEVQVTQGEMLDDSQIATNSLGTITTLRPSQIITPQERTFCDAMFGCDLAKVRFRKIHCTACDVHIGSAPSESHNMHSHPILKTLLCTSCRDFYGDGLFEQGDDATDMFCRWCANGGNLYCCSYCSNTFCLKCIKRNFEDHVRNRIEADEKWKCFVCNPEDLYTLRAICWALLQHVKTLSRILQADSTMSQQEIQSKLEQDDSLCCINKRPKPAKRKIKHDDINNSDDGTYLPVNTTHSSKKESKKKRLNSSTYNDNDINYEHDDIAPLLQCEQSMIVEDDIDSILPYSPYDSSNLKLTDSIINNNNNSYSVSPMQYRPVVRNGQTHLIPLRTVRTIDLSTSGNTSQFNQNSPNKYHSKFTKVQKKQTTGTEAAINSNVNNKNTTIPSVIDIDSDDNDNDNGNTTNTTTINNNQIIEIDDTNQNNNNNNNNNNNGKQNYPRLTVKTFECEINNPIKSIDIILKKLRSRLKIDMNNFENSPSGNDINDARKKLKLINKNIDKVVNELAEFNNRMIRRYKPWKQTVISGKNLQDNNSTTEIILSKKNQGCILPLDMECVDDSEDEQEEIEREGEDNGNVGDDIDTNIDCIIDFTRKLTTFNEKETISQGCNTDFIKTQDKGIQVYETINKDYDMTIGYSLLMRADYDEKKKKEIYKPVVIHDKYFGKYEEQFIFYLQDYEDRIGDTCNDDDNEKENTSPYNCNDKTLIDIIDNDIKILKKQNDIQIIDEISNCDDEESIDSHKNTDIIDDNNLTPDEANNTDKNLNSNNDDDDQINTNDDDDKMEIENEQESLINIKNKKQQINQDSKDLNEKIDDENESILCNNKTQEPISIVDHNYGKDIENKKSDNNIEIQIDENDDDNDDDDDDDDDEIENGKNVDEITEALTSIEKEISEFSKLETELLGSPKKTSVTSIVHNKTVENGLANNENSSPIEPEETAKPVQALIDDHSLDNNTPPNKSTNEDDDECTIID